MNEIVARCDTVVLALGLVLAAACAISGLLISVEQWVEFFRHPNRDPLPATTLAGARLLKSALLWGGLAIAGLSCAIAYATAGAAGASPKSQNVLSRRAFWLIALAVICGFVLRATRLTESLWYDEIASWMEYARYGPGASVGNYFDPSNHIAHTLLVWASAEMFTDALGIELAFRLPALLVSLGAIVAIAWLGRIACGERAAVIAAWLAAVLPVFILEAANARGYAMMIFFSALSSALLLRALRDNRGWQWLAYAIACALGIWSHFVTVLVPLGHGAWLLWSTVRRRHGSAPILAGWCALILSAILTLILCAPILPDLVYLLRSERFSGGEASAPPGLFGAEGWHLLLQMGGSWFWWAALSGLALAGWGAVVARRSPATREIVALTWLGLPILVCAILISSSWMYARFALFIMPGAVVLMTIALDDLWNRRRLLALSAGAAVVAVSIIDLAIRPPRQPLRDAVEFVARAGSNQPIVGIGLLQGAIRIYDPLIIFTTHSEHQLEAILRQAQPRSVVIYYPHLLRDMDAAILRDAGFTRTQTFPGWIDWGRGAVEVWSQVSKDPNI